MELRRIIAAAGIYMSKPESLFSELRSAFLHDKPHLPLNVAPAPHPGAERTSEEQGVIPDERHD